MEETKKQEQTTTHKIGIYLWIWGLLFVLSFFSYMVADVVTGWTGNDLVINEAIYNSFVIVVLGCFGIAGLEKFATRK